MAALNFTRLFSYSGLLSTGMKSMMLVLLLPLLVGCGGNTSPLTNQLQPHATPTPTPVITAAQVFSNHAETWEFKNGHGDLTWIDVIPQPDSSSVWHYTKNADRAYWQPGIASELFFRIELDHGQWYSPDFRVIFPEGCPYSWCGTGPVDVTITNSITPGQPRPYLILADSGTTVDTVFDDFGIPNTRWKTLMYVENGMLISEQWEGPCTHEKWYFAIGRGLVKVIPVNDGSCAGLDPLLTMERIN